MAVKKLEEHSTSRDILLEGTDKRSINNIQGKGYTLGSRVDEQKQIRSKIGMWALLSRHIGRFCRLLKIRITEIK